MASSSSSLFAAVLLLFLLSSTTARLHRVNHTSVSNNLCSKAKDPALCKATIHNHVFASPMELAVFTIKKTMKDINKGIETITATKSNDKVVSMLVDSCKDLYGSSVSDLQSTLDYLEGSGSNGDVDSNTAAAYTYFETCKDGFSDAGAEFTIGDLNDKLQALALNVMYLSKDLKDH